MQSLKKPLTGINIIGIDPSLTSSGLVFIHRGIVTQYCTIQTSPKTPYGERIAGIACGINKFCEKVHDVDVVAVELPYIGRIQGNSCLKVAEARGALIGGLATYFEKEIPIIDVTATEAKKAVGVNSKLKRDESKKAVKEIVIKMFSNMTHQNQDILDAIAVAIAGAKKFKTSKTIQNFIT